MSRDPLKCDRCGGKRPVYKSLRQRRFIRQYRRCEDCNATTKTIKFLTNKRRLTAEEIDRVADLLPDGHRSGKPGSGYEVFLIVEKR